MPDPIEVEVVCDTCGGSGTVQNTGYSTVIIPLTCYACDGDGASVTKQRLFPDSLAALKIALADAVDRLQCGGVQVVENPDTTVERYEAMIWDYERALAAVRNHPDYREPGDE